MLDSPQFSRSHWSILPLGEVIELVYGKALPKNQRKPGKVAVYGSNGPVGYHDTAVVNEPTVIVGRKGSAGAIQFVNEACYPIDTTYYIRPRPGIELDIEFTFYLLGHLDLSKLRTATGVPGLNREDAYKLSIGLPPISEQRRIVDILKRADGIRRLRKQAIQTTRELIPALFVDMFGDPATNPKGWQKRRLEESAIFIGGGTPSREIPGYWNGDIPWVSPKDMKIDRISSAEESITHTAIEKSATNLIPKDSILIVTRSGILRHSLPLAITREPVCINQDIKAIAPNLAVNPYFLFAQIALRRRDLLRKVRTGATVHNLRTEDVKQLEIVVPPLEIQRQFSAQLDAAWSLQDQHSVHVSRADNLFASLSYRAFRGEL